MKDKKKKRRRKFPQPEAWLYYPALCLIWLYMKLRYRVTVDRRALRKIKGPALILSNHLSNYDHFLLAIALFPHRPTFVLSAHFMTKRHLRPILNRMHVITKRMFDSDAGTVLNMMRAARDGRILVLFPEGRLTWTAHSMRITEGTADLIGKLRVPVYRVTPTGAFLTFPKWGRGTRRGKIRIETELMLTAEEAASMSHDEIYTLISDKLRHDDETACYGIRFRKRATAAGLDGILYHCPACGHDGTLTAEKDHISCSACGMEAKLRDDYTFDGAPVATVNEWYRLQYDALDLGKPLSGDFNVGAIGEDGYVVKNAGTAHCTLDRDTFTLKGEVFGKQVEFAVPTETIPAVPITVAHHFDIYHDKTLYHLTPTPDPRVTVRWAIFFDRLTDERIGHRGK